MHFIASDRCWAELIALQDLNLAFEAALIKMPDAVVYVADTIRGIASDAYRREDFPVVDNAVRAFNSNIRFAITHGEPHAVFDVLTQYRVLAEEALGGHPTLAKDIASNLAYYSGVAKAAGLHFVPELFMYDLGLLYRASVEHQCSSSSMLLEGFAAQSKQLSPHENTFLACAVLVTYSYVIRDIGSAQKSVFRSLIKQFATETIQRATQIIESTDSPRYRELTARQVDLNFVPPSLFEDARKDLQI